jgi:hypothetical protein
MFQYSILVEKKRSSDGSSFLTVEKIAVLLINIKLENW